MATPDSTNANPIPTNSAAMTSSMAIAKRTSPRVSSIIFGSIAKGMAMPKTMNGMPKNPVQPLPLRARGGGVTSVAVRLVRSGMRRF